MAEAFETGNPLAPLPEGLARVDADGAEAVAEMLLDRLGLAPCGLRIGIAPGGTRLAGPMLDARLLPDGAAIAISTMRHAAVTAAVIGVLAEPLEQGGTGAPALAGCRADRPGTPGGGRRDLGGAAGRPWTGAGSFRGQCLGRHTLLIAVPAIPACPGDTCLGNSAYHARRCLR